MTPTTYRTSCGSHLGMRLHQEFDEPFCGTCLIGEAGRLLYRELIPTRPTPPRPEAITAQQAAAFTFDHGPTLRVVDGDAA
jgi:hypothetical protein